MDFTINVIYVVIVAFTLIIAIITLVGALIKTHKESSRESERFESWLKTHEKEIQELKKICHELHSENKILKESVNNQNHQSSQESIRLERMISELSKSIGQIDLKLGFLIEGKLKPTNHEG